MKENELDKLFRNKLHRRELIPGDAAWEQLSQDLKNGGRKKFYYWSAAAVIVLMTGLGIFFFNQSDKSPGDRHSIADSEIVLPDLEGNQNDIDTNSNDPSREEFSIDQSQNEELAKAEDETQKEDQADRKDYSQSGKQPLLAEVEQNKPAREEEHEVTSIEESDNLNINIELSEDSGLIHEELKTEEENKPLLAENTESLPEKDYPEVKIVYKKSSGNKSISESSIGLRKVVAIAKDIKEGEFGLGELREAKNELLAFELNRVEGE